MKGAGDTDRRKIIEFLALAFGIAWVSAAALYMAGVQYGTTLSIVLITVTFMWAPAIATIIVQVRRRESIRNGAGLRVGRVRWSVAGWLLPVAIVGATIVIGLLYPGVRITTDYYAFLLDVGMTPKQAEDALQQLEALPIPAPLLFGIQGLVAGLTINALAALGEELGWRGLLLSELSPLGFWRVSLFTGFVWGIWHAPIVLQGHNFPDAPVLGIAVMTLATMAIAPVYTYVTVRARSVLAATFLHGSFNGLAGMSLVYLAGAGRLVTSPVGLAGIGAGLLATAACVLHDRLVAKHRITTGIPLTPWEDSTRG